MAREKPANNGRSLRIALRVAARIDHEVLHLRLRAGAADRAVQHHVAGLAQRALGLELVLDREGAGFDDHARTHPGADDGGDRCIERGRLGQAGDDGRHLSRERLRIRRDLDPGARHGAAAGGIDVVAHHPPAGGDEVLRERAAHDAEADDADVALRHSHPPSPDHAAADATQPRSRRSSSMCRSVHVHSRLSRGRIIPYRRRSTAGPTRQSGESQGKAHDDVTIRLSFLCRARRSVRRVAPRPRRASSRRIGLRPRSRSKRSARRSRPAPRTAMR